MWSRTIRHLRKPTTGSTRSGALTRVPSRAPAAAPAGAGAARGRAPRRAARAAPRRSSWRVPGGSRLQGRRLTRTPSGARVAEAPAPGAATAHVVGGAGAVDDHAAAQPHPIARRHRPSAHEAYRTFQRAGRQGVADVVEERLHEAQGGASAVGKCDLSVNRRAIAFAAVNPWFILGPVLAAWALILSFLGIT